MLISFRDILTHLNLSVKSEHTTSTFITSCIILSTIFITNLSIRQCSYNDRTCMLLDETSNRPNI
ncbi:hypothetical protein YC2023_009014 [Brassica napus]